VDLPAPRRADQRHARTAHAAALAVRAAGAQQLAHRDAHPAQRGFVALFEQLADHQPLGRARRHVAQQLGQAALQRLRHLQQDQDRGVADAVFQVGEMALGDLGLQRQRLARHAAARAQRAHALAQRHQEGVLGHCGRRGLVGCRGWGHR
jgi:hypothetical protein